MERPAPPLKVVDAGCSVAGRFAARLLALDGAEVVRFAQGSSDENHETGDPYLACYLDEGVKLVDGASAREQGALIESADVVLTSYDAGTYHGGFDDARVRRDNPAVVNATTSSFGVHGPYSTWRGGPMADWAAGGYVHITGDPDRPPLIGPLHLCAYVAGYTAAVAIEAALLRAHDTGVGSHIDISTMDAMLNVHQSTFERVAAGTGRVRTGRLTEVYPLTVRPCRDGHVALGVVTDDEFARLLIAIDRPELVADERFADGFTRLAHHDDIDRAIDPFLMERNADDIVAVLHDHDVPAAKVVGELELLANPQLAARRFWQTIECAGGRGLAPGDPVRLGETWHGSTTPVARLVTPGDRPGAGSPPGLPLEGLLVLDFTAFWAGPSATRMLADLGATVVMMERPGGRYDLDADDPEAPAEHVVASLFHITMNRGKQSVVVDLRSESGREVAQQLAERADVLVENFRPGVMSRLGLGPEALSERNHGLVYVSLSGYGSSGPWAGRGSYGPMIEASSSIEHRTGYEGGAPLRLGHTLPDGVGGLVGALSALRGLRKRARGEGGAWFDVSQLEAYTTVCGEEILAADRRGSDRPRSGSRSSDALVQGVFPCAGDDEWIAIRIVDEDALGGLADLSQQITDALNVPAGDAAAASTLDRAIADVTSTWPKEALAQTLQDRGIQAFAVLTPEDLVTSRHLAERRSFRHVPYRGSSVALAGSPLSADPPMVRCDRPAPRVGEHTSTVG